MSTALSDNDEWKVIPPEGRAGAKATTLDRPERPVNRGWPSSMAGTGSRGIGWKRKPGKKKSEMQRALVAKLRTLNSRQ